MTELIQPALSGPELLDQIRDTTPGPGRLAIWWLGQSGFVIKSRQGTLIVDPYLSESLTTKYEHTERPHVRMTAAPIRGGDLTGVNLVLTSHRHTDHLDAATLSPLLRENTDADLALPESLYHYAERQGLPTHRFIGLDDGVRVHRAGFDIRAIPSAHESIETDAVGRQLYLGFVIEAEGLRLYHSGDTVVYPGLVEKLGPQPFDVLFLPINGRDASRGVAGNMTVAEAVDLASVVRPRFVVPHHYDMFTFNTVPVSDFEAEATRLSAGVVPKVLRCGERWEIGS